ncbi:MAG: gluconolaconase [Acidobacteriota bacterium]|nr:gluconolaconase [Acidobacteriota bacterium]
MTTLRASRTDEPRLTSLSPAAAMPGGEVELRGTALQVGSAEPAAGAGGAGASGSARSRGQQQQPLALPHVTIGGTPANVALSRRGRAVIRVPEGAITGDVSLARADGSHSNPLELRVAVPMAENLHPVGNPAVDADGTVYTTVSGSRGQSVPVSIFSIQRDFQMRPHVRDLLNATGLAFGPDGFLYASSRAEGTVYRISSGGAMSTYAEGMGIATGIAFDADGNLYVGDRSGTIFKVGPQRGSGSGGEREIFVYATLEPSIAAYHLAFDAEGVLYVTGPTTSSNQAIWAIDRGGQTSVFYRGLGRAQGLAFDNDGNLYVAASLEGQRGMVRITPGREASLVVSGNNLVGLAFLEDGCAALATRDALYHVCLDIEGAKLF